MESIVQASLTLSEAVSIHSILGGYSNAYALQVSIAYRWNFLLLIQTNQTCWTLIYLEDSKWKLCFSDSSFGSTYAELFEEPVKKNNLLSGFIIFFWTCIKEPSLFESSLLYIFIINSMFPYVLLINRFSEETENKQTHRKDKLNMVPKNWVPFYGIDICMHLRFYLYVKISYCFPRIIVLLLVIS